jgi:hypothetical protein
MTAGSSRETPDGGTYLFIAQFYIIWAPRHSNGSRQQTAGGRTSARDTAGQHRCPTAAYCLLPAAYCLLPTAYCLLPAACCSCKQCRPSSQMRRAERP